MPISTQYTPETYVGDGVTAALPFTWRILAKTDIVVQAKDPDTGEVTTLDLDSDYTIDDGDVDNNSGGDVVLSTPADWDGFTIKISRRTARTQLVNIVEGSTFPAAVITKALDRLTMFVQELWQRFGTPGAEQFTRWDEFAQILQVDTPTLGVLGAEVDVDEGVMFHDITFAEALADTAYEILPASFNWPNNGWWSNKTTAGFRWNFSNESPASAKMVWKVNP